MSSEWNGKLKAKLVEEPPEDTLKSNHIIIPGLSLIEDFLTDEEENELLKTMDSSPWEETLSRRVQHYGFPFNYRTLMLDYSTECQPIPEMCNRIIEKIFCMGSFSSSSSSSSSSSPSLASPSGEGEGEGESKLPSLPKLTQLTVNEYLPGQGIAPHIDTVSCIGPVMFVLNLGSGIVLKFRKKNDNENVENSQSSSSSSSSSSTTTTTTTITTGSSIKKHVYLPAKSLLVMQGECRYLWSHGITPRLVDNVNGIMIPRGRRVSLTFRQALLPSEITPDKLGITGCEKDHVWRVYDNIAIHWNHTRGKRKVHWHRVKTFIEALPKGSLLADIGCGDGKYFGLNPDVVLIGCDRSIKLLEVSYEKTYETFSCDAVKLPFLSDMFDATLCIAVLHHLSTIERRTAAIRELIRITRPGGSVMIQAWALEQEEDSRHNFVEQDVMVPWRLLKRFYQPGQGGITTGGADDLNTPDSSNDNNSNSNSNSNSNNGNFDNNIGNSNYNSCISPEGPCEHVVEEAHQLVFQRYCHVYKKGELIDLCSSVAGCRVVDHGWDKGNWFVQLEKFIDVRLEGTVTGPPTTVPLPFHAKRLPPPSDA